MNSRLPDLSRLAYRDHDSDDHPDGGFCLQLEPVGTLDGWLMLVEQHQVAFGLLADAAETGTNGRALTRPVLFAAHHTCELALKLAIAADDLSAVPPIHVLLDLRDKATQLDADLEARELKWVAQFTTLMSELTQKGFEGRYIEIDSEWCCLALGPLRRSVDYFVALCVTAAAVSD